MMSGGAIEEDTAVAPVLAAGARVGTPSEHVDEGVIRCICGVADDDGFTIQCERCFVWQHAACVRIQKDHVPDVYFCEQCHPRPVDVDFARDVQQQIQRSKRRKPKSSSRKRKELSAGNTKGSLMPMDAVADGTVAKKAKKPRVSTDNHHHYDHDHSADRHQQHNHRHSHQHGHHLHYSNESDADNDHGYIHTDAEDYIPIGKNMIPSNVVPLLLSLSRRLPSQQFDSTTARNSLDNHSAVNDSAVEPTKQEVSSNDSKFPALSNSACIQEISREQLGAASARTSIQHLDDTRSAVKTALVADEPIQAGQLIIECRGQFWLRSDYLKHNVDGNRQQPQQFVFPAPDSELVVDAHRYGNESRFVRTCCQPSAAIRWMRVMDEIESGDVAITDQLRLGLFAAVALLPGNEITVDCFDATLCDAQNCACDDFYTCRFRHGATNRAREAGLDNHVNSNGEELMEPVDGAKLKQASNFSSVALDHRHTQQKQPSTVEEPRINLESASRNPPTQDDLLESSELFQKSDRMLSREERKIRDELIRFARMEKKRQQQPSAGGQRRRKSAKDVNTSSSSNITTSANSPAESTHGTNSPIAASRSLPTSTRLPRLRNDNDIERPVSRNSLGSPTSAAFDDVDRGRAMDLSHDEHDTDLQPSDMDNNIDDEEVDPVAGLSARRKAAPAKKHWLQMYASNLERSGNECVLDPLPSIPVTVFHPSQSHFAAEDEEVESPAIVAAVETVVAEPIAIKEVPMVDSLPPHVDVTTNSPPVANSNSNTAEVESPVAGSVDESSPATPVITQRISLKDYKKRKTTTTVAVPATTTANPEPPTPASSSTGSLLLPPLSAQTNEPDVHHVQ